MFGNRAARRDPAVTEAAHPARPPYASYAAILGTYAGGLAAAGALAGRLKREPQCQTTLDFVALAAASFKAARTVSRDRVASIVRQPFVEGDALQGEQEQPAGDGLRRAMGELVTCTRCVGTWSAAGLAATQIVAPRFGRLLTWSLGAAAANDFLQAGFVALTERADAGADAGAEREALGETPQRTQRTAPHAPAPRRVRATATARLRPARSRRLPRRARTSS